MGASCSGTVLAGRPGVNRMNARASLAMRPPTSRLEKTRNMGMPGIHELRQTIGRISVVNGRFLMGPYAPAPCPLSPLRQIAAIDGRPKKAIRGVCSAEGAPSCRRAG
jgi:hypothetical protein